MELRQLRYFVAVAETLSFTRAAEKLHIAQPALSRQVRQLEEEIGAELLIRGKRGISLTSAGRVLLEEARILLARSAHAAEAARRAQKAAPPLVRVGIAVGLGERVNAALLRHARDFPEVEVQCRNVVSGHQNEALLRFKIDVGFLRPPVDAAHLHSEILFNEPFVALVPRASPFAKHKKLRLRQLAAVPLLLQRRSVSSGLYDKILELYNVAHIVPRVIHTTAAPYEESGAMLVASGKGIYIGVGAALEHPVFSKGIKTILINEPDASIDVQMAWRKDEQSPAVAGFLLSVRKTFHTRRNNSST